MVGLSGKAAGCPPSCPAASSSGSRSPAPSSTGRWCCWPTSPPATSTRRQAREIMDLLDRINRTGHHGPDGKPTTTTSSTPCASGSELSLAGWSATNSAVSTDGPLNARRVPAQRGRHRLRRNVTMTVAMILTTAISIGLFGGGLLVIRLANQSRNIYLDRVESQGSSPTTCRPTTRRATVTSARRCGEDRGPRRREVGALPEPRRRLQRRHQEVPQVQGTSRARTRSPRRSSSS